MALQVRIAALHAQESDNLEIAAPRSNIECSKALVVLDIEQMPFISPVINHADIKDTYLS
jgi:hypothetical protein